jgi:hypothetical protein
LSQKTSCSPTTGFFYDLMREQEWFDPDRLQQPAEASRQMPVDENGLPVFAVARNIRDIVVMADLANPPPERFHHVQEDEIVNVFGFVAQFSAGSSLERHHLRPRISIRAMHPQEGRTARATWRLRHTVQCPEHTRFPGCAKAPLPRPNAA